MTRRGTTTIAITGRTLPGKANGPARLRQEAPVRSINYRRIGNPLMRHHTHLSSIVPADTPESGWF